MNWRDHVMLCPNCGRPSTAGRCLWCAFDANDAAAVSRLRAHKAQQRVQRARQPRWYPLLNGLFSIDLREFGLFLRTLLKWIALGGGVGALAGTASAIFLITLSWATQTRIDAPNLLYLLPAAGFVVGWVYHTFAGSAARGNNLVIEEVNANQSTIPLRMAPLVLFGTIATHLFGGSAGREGTAIQMGASLADGLRRVLGLSAEDRRLMIMAGVSGGFGSVFGTPIAGFIFGMEVQSVGRVRYEGIIPCLTAALVGDWVTRLLGAAHSHYPHLAQLELDPLLLIKVVLAGIAFGITSLLFIELTHGVRYLARVLVRWAPLRPVLGGVVLVLLTLILGTHDYLGLSLPLIENSLDGVGVIGFAFLLKLIFTAVTLGTGFLGGEVTPLFVIGATLGYSLGRLLGVEPAVMASLGFVAVFAGASNTPLACAIMGIELFGGGSPIYLAVACFVAYLASGHRGIYVTQRIGAPKVAGLRIAADDDLAAVSERRGGWLPQPERAPLDLLARTARLIMSPEPVRAAPNESLDQLVLRALREGVRTLPVVDASGRLVGIVTDHDLRRANVPASLHQLKQMTPAERAGLLVPLRDKRVCDVMTQPAASVRDTETLHELLGRILRDQLKRLPVIDASGRLIGMVTRSDVLRELIFADQQPDEDGLSGRLIDWEARVADVIPEPAAVIDERAPLGDVIAQMRAAGQKRVLVAGADARLRGLITPGDLLERAGQAERPALLAALGGVSGDSLRLPELTAADVMTAPLITVEGETTAREALRLLLEHQIKRLPVIDSAGRPVGMVGRDGLMRALIALDHESSD